MNAEINEGTKMHKPWHYVIMAGMLYEPGERVKHTSHDQTSTMLKGGIV